MYKRFDWSAPRRFESTLSSFRCKYFWNPLACYMCLSSKPISRNLNQFQVVAGQRIAHRKTTRSGVIPINLLQEKISRAPDFLVNFPSKLANWMLRFGFVHFRPFWETGNMSPFALIYCQAGSLAFAPYLFCHLISAFGPTIQKQTGLGCRTNIFAILYKTSDEK